VLLCLLAIRSWTPLFFFSVSIGNQSNGRGPALDGPGHKILSLCQGSGRQGPSGADLADKIESTVIKSTISSYRSCTPYQYCTYKPWALRGPFRSIVSWWGHETWTLIKW
jgi:hypothetical protein